MDVQRQWIRTGLEILRGHELNPRLWVAPRHGFDASTLGALHQEGIDYISDGFARTVATHRGVIWIPQQLWEPVSRSEGLWTICIHSNTASESMVQSLREFLGAHKAKFTSFDRVISEYSPAELEWSGAAQRVGICISFSDYESRATSMSSNQGEISGTSRCHFRDGADVDCGRGALNTIFPNGLERSQC